MADRALNEAVARAIGSYMDECDGGVAEVAGNSCDGWFCDGCGVVWGRWGEHMPKHAKVRAYDTDPATQAEMLEWLQERAEEVSIQFAQSNGIIGWQALAFIATACFGPECGWERYPTINEALASLVVVVAEGDAKP